MLGIIVLILAIIVSLLGALVNQMRKKRMRNALGREIRDDELTSINSWMAVNEAEDRRRQANQSR